jgi:hypothetical protein
MKTAGYGLCSVHEPDAFAGEGRRVHSVQEAAVGRCRVVRLCLFGGGDGGEVAPVA